MCNGEVRHPKKVLVRRPKNDRTPKVPAELADLRATAPKEFLGRIFEKDYAPPHVGFRILKALHSTIANYSSKLIAAQICAEKQPRRIPFAGWTMENRISPVATGVFR